MIKISNIMTMGFGPSIRGMRNPMNSWDRSDSNGYDIGANDLTLMQKLYRSGTDHRKFMRMIVAYMDIVAPLYWWKEFDTYKVGTVANSCSTMHKLTYKKFELEDFSTEHLDELDISPTIKLLNDYRDIYLETKDKKYWWKIIQLLPSSYNQRRSVMLSYEVLANMYNARRNHKLDEWRDFCTTIYNEIPYFAEIIEGGVA